MIPILAIPSRKQKYREHFLTHSMSITKTKLKDIKRKEKLEALSPHSHPLVPYHPSLGRIEASRMDLLLLVFPKIILHSTNQVIFKIFKKHWSYHAPSQLRIRPIFMTFKVFQVHNLFILLCISPLSAQIALNLKCSIFSLPSVSLYWI